MLREEGHTCLTHNIKDERNTLYRVLLIIGGTIFIILLCMNSNTNQRATETRSLTRNLLESGEDQMEEEEEEAVTQAMKKEQSRRRNQKWWGRLKVTDYYFNSNQELDHMDYFLVGDTTWTQDKVSALVDTVGAAMSMGRIVWISEPLQTIEGEDQKSSVIFERYYDIYELLRVYQFVNSSSFYHMWESSPADIKNKGYCDNYYMLSPKHVGVTGWGGSGGATPQKMLSKGIYCMTEKLVAFPLDARHPLQHYSLQSIFEESWGGWDDLQVKKQLGPIEDKVLVMVTPLHMYHYTKSKEELHNAIRCRIQLAPPIRQEAYKAMFELGLLDPYGSVVPFVCMHYRRGDTFKKQCREAEGEESSVIKKGSCWQEVSQAVDTLQGVVEKFTQKRGKSENRKVANVFMVTNENLKSKDWKFFLKGLTSKGYAVVSTLWPMTEQEDDHTTEQDEQLNLNDAKKIIRLYMMKGTGGGMRDTLIEQSICAESQVFVRNGWSSLSRHIQQERICRGFSPESSVRWGDTETAVKV